MTHDTIQDRLAALREVSHTLHLPDADALAPWPPGGDVRADDELREAIRLILVRIGIIESATALGRALCNDIAREMAAGDTAILRDAMEGRR